MSDEMLTAEVISVDEAVRIIEARRDSDTAFCSDPGCACAYHRALSSLSEKAQGYEAAVADNAAKEVAMRGALAALTQPATFPADVRAAREFLARAVEPRPGAALLEQHRRALIRAKNEGLEMSARAAGPNRQLAERIRSMKEPEQ